MNRNSLFQTKSLCVTIPSILNENNSNKLYDNIPSPTYIETNSVKKLIRAEVPFKIKNFDIFKDDWLKLIDEHGQGKSFSEHILRYFFQRDENISNDLNNGDTLDSNKINISGSLDSNFSGNVLEHFQIRMTIDEYINYEGEINLYLSQINLLNDSTLSNKLKNILNYSKLEDFSNSEFSRINIWHSYKNTLSQFHYDSYENFLYLCKGKKIFTLSPNNSKLIKSCKYGENSGNQYERVNFKRNTPGLKKKRENFFNEMEEILINYKNKNSNINNLSTNYDVINDYEKIINKISKYFLIQIEVNENEMIYIPEGWWHQVQTVGEDNLAFNFWWDKTNLMLDHNKELYLIKHSVSNLVEKKIKRLYRINMKKSNYRKYRMASLKKLLEKNDHKKILSLFFIDNTDSNYSSEEIDFDLIGMVITYSEFEKYKDSVSDNEGFFQKFWQLMEEKSLTGRLMENINKMKRCISICIIEELKKFYM